MDVIELVKSEVEKLCKEYKNNSPDNYDFWNEHIKYVYNRAIELANKYNADIEIVGLGALLHDIALIKKIGTRKEHHINGQKISEELLLNYKYDNKKLIRVLDCIYNHRSSKNAKTIEELCVADADILAHFDNIPMLFNSAFNRENISLNNINDWLNEMLEKDFNDLSDKTKEWYKDRYNLIKDILIKK
ncbi:MAG: HD domain-containing protein [Bacilli bacterium]|nr:HD domain-containing protein [Bacilli bacterium]